MLASLSLVAYAMLLQEFGQLPCLRHGDLQLVQSSAIMRYLARKHDLYGAGDVEASLIDMIHDGQEDLRTKYIRMIYQNYVRQL